MKRLSLAVLQPYPTQFDGPLFQAIARAGSFDLVVYYLNTDQIKLQVDPELGFSPDWDKPVKSGYLSVCCPQSFLRRLRFIKRECFSARKYDLVIVPGYARLDLTLLAFFLRSQPLGMRLDTAAIYPESVVKARLKRVVLKRLFRRYSVFHPVGSLTADFLRVMGISEDRMFRFAYATDNEYLRTRSEGFRERRAQLLQDQRISPRNFVALGVLKFVPRENPMELLRGFQLFHERFPDSTLILVGAGPLQEEMKTYIAASKLAGSVRLVGYARYSELPKWYAISNVLVHPAIRECWGVSVNEAMACGLPVVAASSVGSSYDLIQNGANGYRYPSGDVNALANCLAMIASRPDGGSELGECSQRLIKPWDFGATMKSLESALLKIKSETPHSNNSAGHFAVPAGLTRGQ